MTTLEIFQCDNVDVFDSIRFIWHVCRIKCNERRKIKFFRFHSSPSWIESRQSSEPFTSLAIMMSLKIIFEKKNVIALLSPTVYFVRSCRHCEFRKMFNMWKIQSVMRDREKISRFFSAHNIVHYIIRGAMQHCKRQFRATAKRQKKLWKKKNDNIDSLMCCVLLCQILWHLLSSIRLWLWIKMKNEA